MTTLPFSFRTSGFSFVPMPEEFAYGNNEPFVLDEAAPLDDQGVVLSPRPEGAFRSPVRVLVELLSHLGAYRRGGGEAHLDAAIRHAEQLILEAFEGDDAEFYPYWYPWHLHELVDFPMNPPWFSAMSQAYAIIGLSRLARLSGNGRYRHHAERAFNAFLQVRQSSSMWVTDVEDEDYIWFEGYPRDERDSDRTINIHLYGVFGLYEYFRETGDDRARQLADGGLTTVLHIMDGWRVPGRISTYCLTHGTFSATYHAAHCRQLVYCYNMTANPLWLQLAEAFVHDWPVTIRSTVSSGKLIVPPGRYRVGTAAAYEVEEWQELEVDERLELDWDVRLNEPTELRTYIRSTDARYKFLLFPEGEAWVDGLVDDFSWAHPAQLEPVIDEPRWYQLTDHGLQQHNVPDIPLRATGRATAHGTHAFRIDGPGASQWWVNRDDVKLVIQE
jgi:hypothetical protein